MSTSLPPTSTQKSLHPLLHYGLLLALMVLWVVVLFQIQATLMYLAWLWIQSAYKPLMWNSTSIVPLSKCTIFILGAIWLMLWPYTTHQFEEVRPGKPFWQMVSRIFILQIGIYLGCALITYIV